MRTENKTALGFILLGLLCWPAASRIRLQEKIDDSRGMAEDLGRKIETYKSRLSRLGPSPTPEFDKMSLAELDKLRRQSVPADRKRFNVLHDEITRRDLPDSILKAHQGQAEAETQLAALTDSARPLNTALALASAGLALSFWALLLLLWGGLRGDVDSNRRRLWIHLAALTASLPGACVALYWWFGGISGYEEAGNWLLVSGLATALAGCRIPSRTRRAEAPSWSLTKTPLVRAPRAALWGLFHVLFAAHGSRAVVAEAAATRLDGAGLRRHALIVAAAAAGLLSVLGVIAGNIGRIVAVFGEYGVLGPPVILLTAAAFWLRKPENRRWALWSCPRCKAGMTALDVDFSFAGALGGLRRCPFCSGLTTRLGAAAGPDLPTVGDFVKPWLCAAAASWVCALGGLIAAGYMWNAAGTIRLSQAREQARGAGHAVDLPRQRPAPPDAENAVRLYEKAGAGLDAAKTDSSFFKGKSEGEFARVFLEQAARGAVTPEETAAARRLVEKHRDLLALLEQGAARPQEHWGVDWDRRPAHAIKVPKYASMIQLVKILACRAVLEAADGRSEAALKDLRLGLTVARSVASEPLLISQLVAVAMSNAMLDAAIPVLGRAAPARARQEIPPLLSADQMIAGFRRASALEHYGFAGSVVEFSWADAWRARTGEEESIPNDLWLYWPFLKFDVASHHRGWIKLDEALAQPHPESKAAWDKAFEKFERTAWLYAQMSVPRLEPLNEKTLAAQARQRLALASFAVRAFKEKEKRWPDALWEVGPITFKDRSLQDPFTGGPFKLLRRNGGLLMYSVGPDGVDDQGAPYDNGSMKGDLAWRL